MAKFRMVHTEFWDDPRVVEELTPEDKFFFLYLLTNSNTTQIGIYQITKKQMAFDMGYSIESVNSLLDRFTNHHKLAIYNENTREIAIRNWGKYNFNRGGKPVLDCVKSELKMVKDISLIQFVGQRVDKKDIKKLYESYYVTCDDSTEKGKSNEINDLDDTSTIRGQEKEEEKEEEQQQEEFKQDAADFYQQNFGVLNPFIGQCLTDWENDLTPELVIEAMKRALKNQKKWNYAEGILKEWANRNVRTLQEVFALDKEFESRGGNNGKNNSRSDGGIEKQGSSSITGGQVGRLRPKSEGLSMPEVQRPDGIY
ncbi:DnaD domain-containing protein [Metabacillus halosaccharovorans]|uniref:DnaD domain protein n=1 Tax=Metabacillus halosaccharovorans TaxID=930124 RepID=A0ABT3DHB9_9BACI|nr:DnaD domain protein [Metabacillus halosaccharovorans]MCV9886268.1 DnaD domain protein [Metabacillus halosaccharovorans]